MDIKQKIHETVTGNPVVLYMKGTQQAPQCGFSASTLTLFNKMGKPYETRDILANPALRSLVPTYSDWPTFPQGSVAVTLMV